MGVGRGRGFYPFVCVFVCFAGERGALQNLRLSAWELERDTYISSSSSSSPSLYLLAPFTLDSMAIGVVKEPRDKPPGEKRRHRTKWNEREKERDREREKDGEWYKGRGVERHKKKEKRKKERRGVGVAVRERKRWRAIGRNVFNCFAPSRLLFRRLCFVNGCWTPTGRNGGGYASTSDSFFFTSSSTLPTRFPPSRASRPPTLPGWKPQPGICLEFFCIRWNVRY